jgi:DNA polymerase elongation subunit (family B)
VQPLAPPKPDRILDFDIETVAAGFADPDWVPQKITCVAWSWVGSDKVESRICGPSGIFGDPSQRAVMLAPLLQAISEADVLTGHNIGRFDLPIVNAECMRLGLEPVRSARIEDTMRLVRSKGFKKGQDNLAVLYDVNEKKLSLSWQEWQDAYDEDGWGLIRRRCESDVISHKQVRAALLAAGYLKEKRIWRA